MTAGLSHRLRTLKDGSHTLAREPHGAPTLFADTISLGGVMTSLEQVRSALMAELGGMDRLKLINARLILRTGINLQDIHPKDAKNADRVARAIGALREMGFKLSA